MDEKEIILTFLWANHPINQFKNVKKDPIQMN